jgi:hypothetical protein
LRDVDAGFPCRSIHLAAASLSAKEDWIVALDKEAKRIKLIQLIYESHNSASNINDTLLRVQYQRHAANAGSTSQRQKQQDKHQAPHEEAERMVKAADMKRRNGY